MSDSFGTPWAVARQAPLSMRILQARILEWIAMPSSRGSSDPGIELGSPALQVDSLPAELPGKLITSWHKDGETMETVTDSSVLGAPKSLQMVTAAVKLKDACSLEEKL